MRHHGLAPIIFGLILLLSLPLLNISCGGDDNSLNDFSVSPYYPRNGQDQVDLLSNGVLTFQWSVYPNNPPFGAVYDIQWSTDPTVFPDANTISNINGYTQEVRGLQLNTLYYWRIRMKNQQDSKLSGVWSFITSPNYTSTTTTSTTTTLTTTSTTTTVSSSTTSTTIYPTTTITVTTTTLI
ncbi:MAG: hypothetical protein HQK58_17105 [Deltaproteobacteria bacterium]|nr:hypothetical protein [Deltaproteobacteria bacterium]